MQDSLEKLEAVEEMLLKGAVVPEGRKGVVEGDKLLLSLIDDGKPLLSL